jgi:hypothetical protein
MILGIISFGGNILKVEKNLKISFFSRVNFYGRKTLKFIIFEALYFQITNKLILRIIIFWRAHFKNKIILSFHFLPCKF